MEKVWPVIREMGGSMLAVSPMTQPKTAATKDDMKLTYALAADPGNGLAEKCRLVFAFSEAMKQAYLSFGTNLEEYNGDDSWTLPMPATFVLAQDGAVTWRFVDADYTKRPEPDTVLEEFKKLAK